MTWEPVAVASRVSQKQIPQVSNLSTTIH
jgi:hypothetical protein